MHVRACRCRHVRVWGERKGRESGGRSSHSYCSSVSLPGSPQGALSLLLLNISLHPASACPLPSPTAHITCCYPDAPTSGNGATVKQSLRLPPTSLMAHTMPCQAHHVQAGVPGCVHHSSLLTDLPEPTLASCTQPCHDLFKPLTQLCHLCLDFAVASKCPHRNTPRSCRGVRPAPSGLFLTPVPLLLQPHLPRMWALQGLQCTHPD